MAHQTEIVVRYAETDQMKVVYYANYFVWMEQARTEYLSHIGLPYNQLETEGYFLPVLEAHARYYLPARYGDKIKVTTSFTRKGIKIRVDYKMFREDELLVEGYTLHVFTDTNNKPVRPPRHLLSELSED